MTQQDLCLPDLTADERHVLSAYKSAADDPDGLSHCFSLNRRLEYGLFPDEIGMLGASVTALDGVFDRCPRLAQPCTVWRAIGARLHYPLHLPGDRFRNMAFWSTSTHRETAIGFLKAAHDGAAGALLELRLPAGLPVYGMETIEGAGGHEMEWLLPRGVLWEVGAGRPFDKSSLQPPHVGEQFSNVVEVVLTAGSVRRAR